MQVIKVEFDPGHGFEVTWTDGRGRRQRSLVSSAERLFEEFKVRYETPSETAGQKGSNGTKSVRPSTPGRPRKFRNAAERQKAYRARKQAAATTIEEVPR
jgi:hypothetical protein